MDVLRGEVVRVTATGVVVDCPGEGTGFVPLAELTLDPRARPADETRVGYRMEVVVLRRDPTRGPLLSKTRVDAIRAWPSIEEAYRTGQPVRGTVRSTTPQGLVVDVNGARCLLGAEGLGPGAGLPASYVGRQIEAAVVRCRREDLLVRLDRRPLLEAAERDRRRAVVSRLEVGQVVTAKVVSVTADSAVLDLDGVRSVVSAGELSWVTDAPATSVVEPGEAHQAIVTGLDRERGELALSVRQATPDPWVTFAAAHPVGSVVRGRVRAQGPPGSVVRFDRHVRGVIPASEYDGDPEWRPSLDQEVWVKVVELEVAARRLWLSLRAVSDADLAAVGTDALAWPPQQVDVWRSSGLPPSTWRDWARFGRAPDDAARWRAAGVSPADAAEWERHAIDPEAAAGWSSASVRPGDAAAWVALGVTPGTARSIVRNWAGPAELAEWIAGGVDATIAAQWMNAGVALPEARRWIAAGIDVAAAVGWMSHFDATTALSWAAVVSSPLTAARWRDEGFEPHEARAWSTLDLRPDQARRWRDAGVGPDDARTWLRNGVTTPKAAHAWTAQGLDALHTGRWASQAFTAAAAGRWTRVGFTAATAVAWRDAGYEPEDAAEWRDARFSVTAALEWETVCRPPEAARWRRGRWTPDDAGRWLDHGFHEPSQAKAWHQRGVTPDVARRFADAGHPPEVVDPAALPSPDPTPTSEGRRGQDLLFGSPATAAQLTKWMAAMRARRGPLAAPNRPDDIFRTLGWAPTRRWRAADVVHLETHLLQRLAGEPWEHRTAEVLGTAMPMLVPAAEANIKIQGEAPPAELLDDARLPFDATTVVFSAPFEITEPLLTLLPTKLGSASYHPWLGALVEHGGSVRGVVIAAQADRLADQVVWIVECLGQLIALPGTRSGSALGDVVVNLAAALCWGSWTTHLPASPAGATARAVLTTTDEEGAPPHIRAVEIRPTARTATTGDGLTSGRIAHIRRGHWRRSRVGPRTSWEYDWRWIDPTYVGGVPPADGPRTVYRLPDWMVTGR